MSINLMEGSLLIHGPVIDRSDSLTNPYNINISLQEAHKCTGGENGGNSGKLEAL